MVIANIPNLTQLPVFRATPNPAVTLERIKVFNQAIEVEAAYVNASIVDVMILSLMEMVSILMRPGIGWWKIYF